MLFRKELIMKQIALILSGLALSAAVLSTAGCSKSEPVTIRVCGSTTIEPFMQTAAAEFQKGRNVHISLKAEGSVSGIDSLIAGTCDIAMSSMEILPEQSDAAREKGIAVKPFLLGYDVIVPIVNPQNRISNITSEQLRNVFSRNITNWSELGEKNEKIDIVERLPSSGTYTVWHKGIAAGLNTVPECKNVSSNSGVLAYVSQHDNAIGYLSHAYLNPEVKALSLDGISPDANELLLPDYKLKRPLFLYVREERFESQVKNFIVFMIINNRGQELLRQNGFFYNFWGEESLPFPHD